MNTTITFYKIPFSKEMNYKFHNKSVFYQWLNSLDSQRVTKNNFQFLRVEKDLNIKINFTQELTFLPSGNFNYMVIREEGDDNPEDYIYYFIDGCIQISPMCLQLSGTIDVLNTFNFESYHGEFSNNFKNYGRYKIDNRSVLNRLHKNRIVARNKKFDKTIPLTFEEAQLKERLFLYGEGNNITYQTYYFFSYALLRLYINFNLITEGTWISSYMKTSESGDTSIGNFELYSKEGTLLGTYDKLSFYWSHITGTTPEGINDFYNFDEYPYLYIRYTYNEENPDIEEHGYDLSDFDEVEFIAKNVIYGKRDLNIYSYERIIDEIPENINPYLFKVKELDLLSKDDYNTWYLIYANENDPANPSDTEAHYINPVKIMFASDNSYSITSSGNRPVELSVYDTILPFINNKAEVMFILNERMSAGGYVEINGTQYPLDIITTSTSVNFNAIKIVRRGNDSSKFEFYGLHINSNNSDNYGTLIGEASSCIISGVNRAYWKSTLWPDDTPELDYANYVLIKDYYEVIYLNSGPSTTNAEVGSFYTLDKTNPKLIKAINIPYAPLEVLENESFSLPDNLVYNVEFKILQLIDNSQTKFDRELKFTSWSPYDDILINNDENEIITQPSRNDDRDMLYESKLYSSEFTITKFVYDSFVFDFRLELIDINKMLLNWDGTFNVRYVVSQNVSSKFMFQFTDYVYMKYEIQNYNNILIIERDNEVALYTNAYINYLRMGYNFDLKQNERNNAVNWASVGLSLIGSVASFASSGITNGFGVASGIGLATSTLTNLGRAIANTKNNDENLQAKLLQNQLQSSSVTGTNDIDLLKAYSKNKAKLVRYEMNEATKKAIYNLFYYCGYSCNKRYSDVTNFHTRIHFNFIQGDLIIEQANFDKDIQTEIVNKWKDGFSILWEYQNSYTLPTDLKENWETYLVED